MCRKPYRQGAAEFGCGQCTPCRVNARRLWTSRLYLEAAASPCSVFVTLTMSDAWLNGKERLDYVEEGCTPVEVSVREGQLFIKRVRSHFPPESIRYLIVGEYGEKSARPHYHALLFGPPELARRDWLQSSWHCGHSHLGYGERASFSYVCGYAVKKLTRRGDPRLNGRAPEFVRRSLKPGLGAVGLEAISRWLATREGARFLSTTGDVPRVIRFEGKVWPIGRYLSQRLRDMAGVDAGPDRGTALSLELYEEQRQPGGRALREQKRRQVARQVEKKLSLFSKRRL